MTVIQRAKLFFPFLSNLSAASHDMINEGSRFIEKPKGSELLARGDEVDGAYLVLSGTLNVYTIDARGRETSLYRVGDSQSCLFALNTIFANVSYPAWVRVSSSSATVLLITGEVIKALHDSEKPFRDWVFSVQSQRLFDLISSLEEIQTLSVEERLRSYLLRAADAERKIRDTHETIANYLGTAREVVTRNLDALATEGAVGLSRGCIDILDADKLSA